jgi:hypothetical protein
MSTILNALKRAEETRSHRTLGQRIVMDRHEGPPRRGALLYVCAAIPVLLFLALFFYLGGYMRSDEEGAGRGSPLANKAAPLADEQHVGAPLLIKKNGGSLPKLDLSGVLWDGIEYVAIINDKPLTEGERIEGVEIVKIGLDSVKVVFGDNSYDIALDLK